MTFVSELGERRVSRLLLISNIAFQFESEYEEYLKKKRSRSYIVHEFCEAFTQFSLFLPLFFNNLQE